MPDPVEQIKDRLNIVDVVAQYVKLAKAGKNYKGLSPFKNEKTPSFYVQPDKGLYYDFSSGRGGDMFTFVEAMEGLDFQGALRVLAERAGVELRPESKRSRTLRERLYEVLEQACLYYVLELQRSSAAREYLAVRGLTPATVAEFRLGFVPPGWSNLHEHLTKHGFNDHELERAGLIKRGDKGRYYDRFRSRIMFPLADASGRVVAFSGRIFGEAAQDRENAKYLNSPETDLFDKGRVLYGYDKAKQHIRKYDFSILVEGQMDLVLSHQAGYRNTVAVSGTGLTHEHLTLLDRLSKRLVMAFDADTAGIASSGRAAALALSRGMDVKVARVPVGKDPADCINEDPRLWKQAIKDSTHIVEFYLAVLKEEHDRRGGDMRRLALAVRDQVLPYIARIPSGVDQAHFVRTVAQTLNMAEEAIWQDVQQQSRALAREHEPPPVRDAVSAPSHTRREHAERALAGFLYWQQDIEPRILNEPYLSKRAAELKLDLEALLAAHHRECTMLAFQAELLHDEHADPHQMLDTLMRDVVLERFHDERHEISRALQEAEARHDEQATHTLLRRFKELSTRIENLEQPS